LLPWVRNQRHPLVRTQRYTAISPPGRPLPPECPKLRHATRCPCEEAQAQLMSHDRERYWATQHPPLVLHRRCPVCRPPPRNAANSAHELLTRCSHRSHLLALRLSPCSRVNR